MIDIIPHRLKCSNKCQLTWVQCGQNGCVDAPDVSCSVRPPHESPGREIDIDQVVSLKSALVGKIRMKEWHCCGKGGRSH